VLLFLIGAVSVIMLIIGGIRYTISQGDSSAVTSAKNTILYAIIGIIVALLAYAIVNFVLGSFTGGSSTT
jgi:multisubunit Na+/H+ antiporter MnhB subunit